MMTFPVATKLEIACSSCAGILLVVLLQVGVDTSVNSNSDQTLTHQTDLFLRVHTSVTCKLSPVILFPCSPLRKTSTFGQSCVVCTILVANEYTVVNNKPCKQKISSIVVTCDLSSFQVFSPAAFLHTCLHTLQHTDIPPGRFLNEWLLPLPQPTKLQVLCFTASTSAGRMSFWVSTDHVTPDTILSPHCTFKSLALHSLF